MKWMKNIDHLCELMCWCPYRHAVYIMKGAVGHVYKYMCVCRRGGGVHPKANEGTWS